jgi:hypothetical protein
MIRLGFVSNSSSTSFVIPKCVISEEDLVIYDYHYNKCDDYCGDQHLYENKSYIYGEVSYHNDELNRIFGKYIGKEGVDYGN